MKRTTGNLISVIVLMAALWAAYSVTEVCYAASAIAVEPPATGEETSCSEDGLARLDVTNGQLHWDRQWLAFGSGTTYNIEFGLSYVSEAMANPLLGAAPWRHTYDISITYTTYPLAMSLSTPRGVSIPFFWNAGTGAWHSTPSYGVFLQCVVLANPTRFRLFDKFGNFIEFDSAGKPTTIVDRWGRVITLSYNLSGNLQFVTDMWGRSIELLYDATPLIVGVADLTIVGSPTWLAMGYTGGDLTSVQSGYSTGALFSTWCFTYDAANRMATYADPDSILMSFAYDGSGRMNLATDPAANTWAFAFNAGSTLFTDRRGNSFTFWFNGAVPPQITQVDFPAPTGTWGSACSEYWTYNSTRRMLSHTDRRGNTAACTYDASGNMLTSASSVTTPGGVVSVVNTWTYNAGNLILSHTDPNGNATSNSYDGLGRLLVVTLPGPVGGPFPTTTYGYDANSLPVTVTDSLNNTTTTAYDAIGCVASTTSPCGVAATYVRDSWGHVLTVTDAAGCTNRTVYDSRYFVAATEVSFDTLGGVCRTEFTYTPGGKLLSKKLPEDVFAGLPTPTYTFQYDSLMRSTSATDCYGNAEHSGYDANGNKTSFANAVDWAASRTTATWAFDTWNRRYCETDALAYCSSQQFDSSGNAVSTTDKCGNSASAIYDELNRMVDSTDALGNHRYWEYDLNGNKIKYTDACGNIWTWSYDECGHPTVETDPLHHYATITYDVLGRPSARTDKNGNSTQLTYDADGRILTDTNPLGGVTNYSYDIAGRLLRKWGTGWPCEENYLYDIQSRNVRINDALLERIKEVSHDRNGRVRTETDGEGNVTTNGFNRTGWLISIQYADNSVATFAYDASGRKTSGSSAGGVTWNYSYDTRGLLWQEWGTYTQNGQQFTYCLTYAHDGLGRETGRVNAVGLTWSVTYDALGRGSSKTDPDKGTTNFTYDAEGRLLSEVNAATAFFFTYDPCGQVLTKTDGVNALWQFAYDFNGNKTQVVEPLGNTTDSGYNALNQCTSVIERGILNNPADDKIALTTYNADGTKFATTNFAGQVINYYNDYRGRLWMQSYVDVLSPLNSVTETFAYDHCNRLTAHSHSSSVGQTTNSYVYGSRGWITSKTVTLVSPGAPTLVKTSSRGYDFDGKVISETTTEGDINTFEFNEIGWCTSSTIRDITVLDVTRSYLRTTYEFDTGGRKTVETRFSGCPASWMFSNHLLYTYGTSNLTATETIESWVGFWNTEDLVTYTYDSAGRVITRSAFIDVKSFGYDAAGQLIYDNGMWQSYDLDGNRLTRGLGIWTYAYDMFNHLVTMTYVPTSTTYAYTYDASGNEVFRGDRPAETKIYDPLNRLVRHVSTQTSYVNFIYDEKNDMVMEEHVNGNGAQQQVAFRKAFTYYISRKNCVQYSWDNNPNSTWVFQIKWKHSASCDIPPFTPPITPIHTGASDEIFSFCLAFSIDCYDLGFLTPSGQDTTLGWQPGMGTPLFVDAKIVSIANGGVWTGYTATTGIIGGFYVQDNSACISYVLDANTNDLLTAFDYNGDGSNTQVVGNQPIEHKFASGYEYPNGDMVYFRSRWYNISAGRFCSEDPLGDIDHTNLYLYCANDPVGNLDPWGEDELDDPYTNLLQGAVTTAFEFGKEFVNSLRDMVTTTVVEVLEVGQVIPPGMLGTMPLRSSLFSSVRKNVLADGLILGEGKAALEIAEYSLGKGIYDAAAAYASGQISEAQYYEAAGAGITALAFTFASVGKGRGGVKEPPTFETTMKYLPEGLLERFATFRRNQEAMAKRLGCENESGEVHHGLPRESAEQALRAFLNIELFRWKCPFRLHRGEGVGLHSAEIDWNAPFRELKGRAIISKEDFYGALGKSLDKANSVWEEFLKKK